jgi:hypothetical protein
MAQTDWVFNIESKIYTIVKTRLTNALKDVYPKLLITQQQRLNDDTQLPVIYIKMLDSPEIGADLDGSTVNAMLVTFETHITVSKDSGLSGLRKISASVLENFKKLRFQMATRGEITRETSDTYTTISRYNRVIGAEEEINF